LPSISLVTLGSFLGLFTFERSSCDFFGGVTTGLEGFLLLAFFEFEFLPLLLALVFLLF